MKTDAILGFCAAGSARATRSGWSPWRTFNIQDRGRNGTQLWETVVLEEN